MSKTSEKGQGSRSSATKGAGPNSRPRQRTPESSVLGTAGDAVFRWGAWQDGAHYGQADTACSGCGVGVDVPARTEPETYRCPSAR